MSKVFSVLHVLKCSSVSVCRVLRHVGEDAGRIIKKLRSILFLVSFPSCSSLSPYFMHCHSMFVLIGDTFTSPNMEQNRNIITNNVSSSHLFNISKDEIDDDSVSASQPAGLILLLKLHNEHAGGKEE